MERYQREAKEKALLTSHGRKWEEKKTQDQQQAGLFNRPVLQPNDLEILEAEELVGAARSSTSTTTPKTNMFVATGNFLGLS